METYDGPSRSRPTPHITPASSPPKTLIRSYSAPIRHRLLSVHPGVACELCDLPQRHMGGRFAAFIFEDTETKLKSRPRPKLPRQIARSRRSKTVAYSTSNLLLCVSMCFKCVPNVILCVRLHQIKPNCTNRQIAKLKSIDSEFNQSCGNLRLFPEKYFSSSN
jgi:hypothetical protein